MIAHYPLPVVMGTKKISARWAGEYSAPFNLFFSPSPSGLDLNCSPCPRGKRLPSPCGLSQALALGWVDDRCDRLQTGVWKPQCSSPSSLGSVPADRPEQPQPRRGARAGRHTLGPGRGQPRPGNAAVQAAGPGERGLLGARSAARSITSSAAPAPTALGRSGEIWGEQSGLQQRAACWGRGQAGRARGLPVLLALSSSAAAPAVLDRAFLSASSLFFLTSHHNSFLFS